MSSNIGTVTATAQPTRSTTIRDFTEQQLSISALQPRHVTTYVYSSFEMSTAEEQSDISLVLLPPASAANRYEPIPLLPSTAGISNSGWEDPANHSYYTLITATEFVPGLGTILFLDQPQATGLAGLLDTMDFIDEHIGRTVVQATLFRQKGPDPTVFMCVKTAAIWYQAKPHSRNRVFLAEIWTFPIRDFRAMLLEQSRPAWWYTLDDLVNRRSDFAARHVSGFMKEHSAVDRTRKLRKTPRELDIVRHLPAAITITKETSCAICLDRSEQMIMLSCGDGKHTFCKDHITEWYKQNLPKVAGCPTYRQPILGELSAEDLEYGLTNGVYLQDVRYSQWENYQRAIGDLDSQLAINVQDRVPGKRSEILEY